MWFDEATASFYKATWPNFFGLLVMQRPHEDDQASPIDYLERWQLHNKLFGDEIAFFDPAHQVATSDTHRGNLILMEDGLLAPIDLRIQPLDGVLLELVQNLCQRTE